MSAQAVPEPAGVSPVEDPQPTLWQIPDVLWEQMQSLIDQYDPKKSTGRPRTDARKAFDGILFRMRTACQWNHLPKEFGDDSSVHRTFQRWQELGLFQKLFAFVLTRCEELDGVDWQWQAADGCLNRTFGAPKKGRLRKRSVPIPPTGDALEPK
jgi:putative transposase